MRIIKAQNIARNTLSLVLIVVFFTQVKAQERPTDFLKDYFLVGAFGQFTNNLKGDVVKEDPSVVYSLDSYFSAQFGIVVNVYQTKHFNFKTGVIVKQKAIRESITFTKEQTGLDFDYSFWQALSGDDNMWSVPLIAEYIIPISDKIKWMVAPSFTISYYKDYGGGGGNSFGNDPVPTFTFIYDDLSDNPIYTSAEISTGFYFLFKYFMLQPEFRYSKSLKDVRSGSYEVTNFGTEPNSSTGTFTQSGDYWGVSLTVYIKKKRKN